jgi:glycosyltransferase involved in cell wall biosynthesis
VRIRHFTFSPLGGAGRVASDLAKWQRIEGYDSDLLVKTSSNLSRDPFGNPLQTMAASFDNFVIKRNGHSHLLSVTRSRIGSARRVIETGIEKLDVAHLHWVEGVINSSNRKLLLMAKAKIIWTLHDFSAFSGGCHTNDGCNQYESGCQECPLARESLGGFVKRNFSRKLEDRRFYESVSFVAPSSWIAEKARNSKLLVNSKIEVIPNPVHPIYFEKRERSSSRMELNIPLDAFVVCLIANNLEDPLKRLDRMNKVLEALQAKSTKKVLGIFVGAVKESTKEKYPLARFTGLLSPEQIAKYLSSSDVLVSTSVSESAGQTIQEAAAKGVPSVSFYTPGLASTVENNANSILVSGTQELVEALLRVIEEPAFGAALGRNARKNARENHSLESVGEKYLRVYRSQD